MSPIARPLVVLVLAVSPLVPGCAQTLIPNTDVPDTAENREIVDFVEEYRHAVEERNPAGILRLVSERYFDDNGTPGADDEICVIGGGEIYRKAMPIADRLYVTHVLASPDGDTTFPAIEQGEWRQVSSEDHPVGEKDTQRTRFVVYERRR